MNVLAKVASILTPTTLAITAGSASGVSTGDSATISSPVEVRDPDTHEVLGDVTVPKIRCEVISVRERVAVIKVTESYEARALRYLKRVTEDEDLADWKTIYVEPGDLVEIETSLPF